jgi:hypothetical protein
MPLSRTFFDRAKAESKPVSHRAQALIYYFNTLMIISLQSYSPKAMNADKTSEWMLKIRTYFLVKIQTDRHSFDAFICFDPQWSIAGPKNEDQKL